MCNATFSYQALQQFGPNSPTSKSYSNTFPVQDHHYCFVRYGLQSTLSTFSLQHCCSTANLAVMAAWSISSRIHWLVFVRCFPVACSESPSRHWTNSCCWFHQLGIGCTWGMSAGAVLNHPSTPIGMSTHAAQWSLGIPSPNARYPDWINHGGSSAGTNIPSIGFWPGLWVLGVSFPCCVMMASIRDCRQATMNPRVMALLSNSASTVPCRVNGVGCNGSTG